MKGKNIGILGVAVIAIVAILAISFIEGGQNEGSDSMIEMDVQVDGSEKLLTLTSTPGVFKDTLGDNDLMVFYTVLDGYVVDDVFDYDAFFEDLETGGIWCEELQEYLPPNTVLIEAPTIDPIDKSTLDVGFSAEGRYAIYMVAISPEALEGVKAVYVVSAIDIPEPIYKAEAPVLSIVDDIRENTRCESITLSVENTEFLTTISADDVQLAASLSSLNLIGVRYIDSNTVVLQTDGYVSKGTSGMATVIVSADATKSDMELWASRNISDHSIAIDPESFEFKDGILGFNVRISNDIVGVLKSVRLGSQAHDLTDSDIFFQDQQPYVRIMYDTDAVDIIGALSDLEGLLFVPCYEDRTPIQDLGAVITIPSVTCNPVLESITSSGKGFNVAMTLSASGGDMMSGIVPDDIIIVGNFDKVDGVKIDRVSDGYDLRFHIDGLQGPTVSMIIDIKNGLVSMWNEQIDVKAPVMFNAPLLTGDTPSTDEMIEALYGHMEFSKIFSKIGYAVKGVGIIIDILGATGVIDMRSATDIAVAEINVKCDEIKKMLADQAVTLERMNQKLDLIVEMLKEQRLLELSANYSKYTAASNDLSNAIYAYSSAIKSDIWKFVQGDHDGKTFYIYFTTDCVPSVMPGDFFSEHKSGSTLDGKSIIPGATVAVTIEKDVTFSEARMDVKFGSETEKRMVNDLTRYVKEKVMLDGQTSYVVSNGSLSKSYSAEELAQAIYDCMVVKYTEVESNSTYGEDVLRLYYRYTETMASLIVNPDGSIIVNFDLRSNPVLAATEIMQTNFNFEKEAHDSLKALNDSFTLYLYNYTLLAQSVEKLNSGSSDNVQKHFDASMKFLSNHRGYNTSKEYSPKTFCYVTGTNVRSDFRHITAQATYHSSDGFDHNVSDSPRNIGIEVKDFYTGAPEGKVLINDQQLNKIKANYDRLYADDPAREDFKLYLGGQVEGERFLDDRLIIQWDGIQTYNDGYHVKLYSNMNLVNPGHSAQLMDSGHTYEISGTMDKSGFLKQFKAYSSEVYGKYYAAGKAYSLSACQYVGKTCNCDNCLYAVGFFCKHVSAWSNDESALLTCEKDVPNISRISERNGNDWTVGSEGRFTVLIIC